MSTTTYFMDMTLPVPGYSTDYTSLVDDIFETIDSHDHVDVGANLNQNSINWSDVDLQGKFLFDCDYVKLNEAVSSTAYSLFVDSGDLYYVDGSLNSIKLTSNGQVNYIGSYSGFYGNLDLYDASCNYTDVDNTYTFDSNGTTTIVSDGLTSTDISTDTVEMTGTLYNDAQVDMYQDTAFPGDLDGGYNYSFFVDKNGSLTSAPVTEENVANSFLVGGGSNDVSYIYGSGLAKTWALNNANTNSRMTFTMRSGTYIFSEGGDSTSDYISQSALSPDLILAPFPGFTQTTNRAKQKPKLVKVAVQPSTTPYYTPYGGFDATDDYTWHVQFDISWTDIAGNTPIIYGWSHQILYNPTFQTDGSEYTSVNSQLMYNKTLYEGVINSTTNTITPSYFLTFQFGSGWDLTFNPSQFIVLVSFYVISSENDDY